MEGNPENRLSDRKKRITSRTSMENRELGTLLVQPVKALNFSLTATVDNRKKVWLRLVSVLLVELIMDLALL